MNQEISLKALAADFQFTDGPMYATVDVKSLRKGAFATWVVTGPNDQGLPSILLMISTALRADTELGLESEVRQLAAKHVFPLASALSATPGVGERVPLMTLERRSQVFLHHMSHHFSSSHLESMTLQLQTECLFRMATYLELTNPLKLIAQFQKVATSTVEKRVSIARAKGRLPKASEGRVKHEATWRNKIAQES